MPGRRHPQRHTAASFSFTDTERARPRQIPAPAGCTPRPASPLQPSANPDVRPDALAGYCTRQFEIIDPLVEPQAFS